MRVRLVNTQCIVDDGMYDLYDIAFAQASTPERVSGPVCDSVANS